MDDSTVRKINRDGEMLGISPLYLRAKCIIAGFSGGADSSLLLSYFVKRRKEEPDFPWIAAVHVNHMLRGNEADRDEEFCRRRCAELDVPLIVRKVDVPSMMMKTGLGAEECARNARYQVFKEIAGILESGESPEGITGEVSGLCAAALREGFVICATAHNADDNLETALFNLARGGGARGLSGIPPVREDGIVRPLLCLGANEIRKLCHDCEIPYVTDSTNEDEGYTRNYIRREIIPLIKNVSPSAPYAAVRAGISLREDEDYFRSAAMEAMGRYLPSPGEYVQSVEVPRELFADLAPPVMVRAIVMLAAAVTPVAMGAEHIWLARKLILGDGTGKVSLPDGAVMEVSKYELSVSRSEREPEEFCISMRLPKPGECLKYQCPEAGFDLYLSREMDSLPVGIQNIYKLSINAQIRFDTIYGKICARNRLPGDTLLLGGHRRKLKKMICDKGIPASRRRRLPVIVDDCGVIMTPGLPVRGPSYVNKSDISSGNVLYVLYCLYWRI